MSVDKAARSKINSPLKHSDLVRENILNAAQRCYQKQTIEKVHLVDIALEAKLSRATVYRYFTNKKDVFISTMSRTLQGLLSDASHRLENTESFAEFTVETLVMIFDEVPREPLLNVIFFLVVHKEGSEAEIYSIFECHFRSRFEASQKAGILRGGIEFEQFMSWILRVLLSYKMTQSTRSTGLDFRKTLWQFFIPSLIR